MNILRLVPYYFKWHYGRAFIDIYSVSENFIWFLYNFFSIELLLQTFFTPWKRMKERYKGGLRIGNFLATLFINTLMRIIGMLMRTFVIIFGIASIILFVLLTLAFYIFWIILPIFLITFFVAGLIAMF
ncbi:hypothetical protein IT397_03225, partial [Candidatus Nomurabacteria bacterium]|nr:hypothetical protein [Candidatus Nomurabacteria bacterium]